MNDQIFRSKQSTEDTVEKPVNMGSSSSDTVSAIDTIEPPFTDYETIHKVPFVVDHFELGKYWNTDSIYTKEVTSIENYLRLKVEKGDIDNSLEAAEETMKRIEKTAGVDKTDSTVVKVGKLAAYVDFLLKVDNLKVNTHHYGSA